MPQSKIIDGKAHAANILQNVKYHVQILAKEHHITPGLAVIIVGQHPASLMYVRLKAKRAGEVGIISYIHSLNEDVSQVQLLNLIHQLNDDKNIHGILVQLPLPSHIDLNTVLDSIDPAKDVDGFTPRNIGLLHSWRPSLEPCTPQGVIYLLKQYLNLSGKIALVVGRSMIVGRPMASMLLRENCTTLVLHSYSEHPDLLALCHKADILVVAAGKPNMIKGEWIKEGACVIDVGITKTADGKIYGDVEFNTAYKRASFITPVPGGVGPMTVACLLANTVKAAYWRIGVHSVNPVVID